MGLCDAAGKMVGIGELHAGPPAAKVGAIPACHIQNRSAWSNQGGHIGRRVRVP